MALINTATDKKKALWKEIYENAMTDRLNAYMVWHQLIMLAHDDSSKLAIHGQTISKLLERMSRSTDQLLKLAELIANCEERADRAEFSSEDMFKRING